LADLAASVAHQRIGTQRDDRHEKPRGSGDSIPKRILHIALRINHVVHSGGCQRLNGRWLGSCGFADRRPKSGLQLGRPFGELLTLIFILVKWRGRCYQL
jgi:hypothetical protein